jgi:hypothetical protein
MNMNAYDTIVALIVVCGLVEIARQIAWAYVHRREKPKAGSDTGDNQYR